MPNYYGPQRFGSRGDAFIIGEHLLHHRHEEAIQNCSQAISLLDTLIAESESPSEPVRWKLAVALNNLGVEHQYLRK